MSKKYLLIVRAGDRSLHTNWLKAEPNRNWDLHISYFGDRQDPYPLGEGITLSRDKGQKYIGLHACLEAHPHFLDYDYIGFPDDDLKLATGTWSEAFDKASRLGCAMLQPSLDHRSFFFHHVLMNRKGLSHRHTDLVELMMPLMRSDVLRQIMPLFLSNKSSLGMDLVWSKLLIDKGEQLIVDDQTQVLHTRRIGGGTQYNGLSPYDERDALMKAHGVVQRTGKSLLGVYPDGRTTKNPWRLRNKLVRPFLLRRLINALGFEVVE